MKAIIPLTLLGLLGTAAACSHKSSTTAEGPMEVTVARPVIDSVVIHQTYPGYLKSSRSADIVARVSGNIVAKHYNDGDYVRQGQQLLSIDPTTYSNKLQQAEAQLASATASEEFASRQYEAMKKALESDAVSKMDVIQAESNWREAQAQIKSCRAAVANARQMLGWCTVRAPFAGQVSAPAYTIGAYVGGEGAPVTVASIVNDSIVRANFSVTDNRFLQLTETPEGKRVRLDSVPVTFGDSIAKTFYGKFNYSGIEVDQATGTIRMRLDIDNRYRELRQGMYCSVHLPVAVDPRAMMILDAAIGTDQLGKYVYLVNDSDKIVYTPLEVGELVADSLRIVTKGMTPSDRYVTRALLKVRDGMTVKPVGDAAKPTPQPK